MNFSDKAKQIIATVAPTLGAAFGGPLGALAGKVLSTALGTTDDKALEKAVIAGDPATMLAMHNADLEFQKHMADLGVQYEQLADSDRASARDREAKTGDWTPRILAALIVFAWGAVQFDLLKTVVDASMREIVLRMLGTLDAALMLVLAYYFGSSAGSARKTELMGAGKPTQ